MSLLTVVALLSLEQQPLIFAQAPVADAPAAPKRYITGTVIDGTTQQPLRKTVVRLVRDHWGRAQAENDADAVSVTGTDGKFKLGPVSPGDHLVGYAHSGYLNPRQPDHAAVAVHVEESEDPAPLQLRLMPYAVLSGTVIDEDGDPVDHATVQLMKRGESGRWESTSGAESDDQGRYRITGVAPGSYALLASAEPEWAQPKKAPDGRVRRYLGTLYPSALSIADAERLQVGAGVHLSGRDIRLRAARTFQLTGTLDLPPALSGWRSSVAASMGRADLGAPFEQTPSSEQRRFHLRVPEGRVQLTMVLEGEGRRWFSYPGPEIDVSADTDLGSLSIPAPVAVAGQFTISDGSLPAGMSVDLIRLDSSFAGRRWLVTTVDAQGRWHVDDLIPGPYRVLFSAASGEPGDQIAVSEVTLHGEGYRERSLALDSGDVTDLVVALGTDAGSVEGQVELPEHGSSDRLPTVAYAPVEMPLVSRFHRPYATAEVAANGKFRIPGLAAGDYRVWALDCDERAGLDSLLEQFASRATVVHVDPKGKSPVELKIVKTGLE